MNIKEFELMKNTAELKALSKFSLENPLNDEQLYLKVENSPIDKEDLNKLEIPIYNFKNIEYVKINITDNFKNDDWKKMFIIDIELTEMNENENKGSFNGLGFTANKNFYPLLTKLIIGGNELK